MKIEESEDSSSMQQHENIVNDNLGQIAKNIAKNFAKTSKNRSSLDSIQSKEGRGIGANVIKLEGPMIKARREMSAEKDLQSKEKDTLLLIGANNDKIN